MAGSSVEGYRKISTAVPVDSLQEDFNLIGWMGSEDENQVAPLISISSSQLRQFIYSVAGRSSVSTISTQSSRSVQALSEEPTVEVSVEELFDELHNQYKNCFIQLQVSDDTVSVISSKNVDGVELSTVTSDNGLFVTTNIPLTSLSSDTLQVSFLATTQVPTFTPYFLESANLQVVVPKVSGKVNITFLMPLVAEGTKLKIEQQ